ncbi:hypothetical protein QTP88_007534 [Uroleucon formosanum]
MFAREKKSVFTQKCSKTSSPTQDITASLVLHTEPQWYLYNDDLKKKKAEVNQKPIHQKCNFRIHSPCFKTHGNLQYYEANCIFSIFVITSSILLTLYLSSARG